LVVPPTDPKATPLTQAQGEWNSKPSDQFVPHGRSRLACMPIHQFGPPLRRQGRKKRVRHFLGPPAGKRRQMTTKVKNPEKNRSAIIRDRQQRDLTRHAHPTRSHRDHHTPVFGAAEVSVKYTGTKKLVILETAFE